MNRRVLAVAAVLSATVLVVLDASVVNLALPTLSTALGAHPSDAVLVVTAYQLALVMALLPCAALGESIGFRKVYGAGVSLFMLASLLCAAAPSLPWLVAARFLQGLGGAAVMALGVALLRQVVPPGSLGAAIGWNAMAVALASAAGPSIGALILAGGDWRWLFAVNLPVAAASLLAGRALPDIPGRRRPLDGISIALNATVFAGAVTGADLFLRRPGAAVTLFAAAALALVMLVRREGAKAAPLVPLDLLRLPPFRMSAMASVLCFTGQAAALLALPFHLQQGVGLSPLTAGLYMTAWPLAVAVMAQVSGRLSDRVPTAWLCAAGASAMALGLAGAAAASALPGPAALLPFILLSGLGFGLFQTPNNRNLFLSAPAARSGAAGGMQGVARLTGQTAGAVAMGMIFAREGMAQGPRLGLAVAATCVLASGLVSLARAPQAAPSAPRAS